MPSPVHLGLIGYGLAGSVFHAPLIRSTPELLLSAVATSRREQITRDLPGVRAVADVQDLFLDSEIDLIVVASPTGLHFEHAQAALRAGKHVVVDKPVAVSVAEANLLMQTAEECGRIISVFQNRRWDNDFLTVRQCIGEGWLGRVYSYEVHYDRFRPVLKAGWREQDRPGSGLLYDLGSHLIDQAFVLFGMPDAVTADVFAQRPGAQAPDYFHLILHYGNIRAVLHASNLVREPGPHFAVHGDGGSFLKYGMDSQEEALKAGLHPGDPGYGSDEPGQFGLYVNADGTRRTIETVKGAYECFYSEMAACVLHGGTVPVPLADARDGLRVIEAAMRSAREKCRILLDFSNQ